ncbi:nucleotidyltransferase family protein [Alkalihalobacterium elongatum]|uniref:nucleotidyltransferase family protein n=1 Tax=Alkalihalobacterium elongatum TaxID=2675466 RepID=UPI001F19B9B6|nr:nucleotidyltransferase family protein [Alkalihalobacterium elongatum]
MRNAALAVIENQILASKRFLKEEYGIMVLGIFGSYSRNEQTSCSDIDILIKSDMALGFEFLSIKYYLEDKLGLNVDLATEAMILAKPELRDQILKEIVYLWKEEK